MHLTGLEVSLSILWLRFPKYFKQLIKSCCQLINKVQCTGKVHLDFNCTMLLKGIIIHTVESRSKFEVLQTSGLFRIIISTKMSK